MKNDIKIVDAGGNNTVPTYRWQTEANSTAIYAGEPAKLKAAGSPYAIACVDGDMTVGTDTQFVGFAAGDSTHTASVDGYVDIYMPLPGIIYEAKAKTAASVDTQSEINALCGDRKVLDLTGSTWTVDEGEADNANNMFLIVGGDPVRKILRFMVVGDGTVIGA